MLLPVKPGIQVVVSQRVNNLLGEVKVFAGVGDEDVGHTPYLVILPNSMVDKPSL